ncbi:PAS domain-containing protein [Candidatus Regiella endosymbiont of Tuberolachnus salignus]|uniref:PAS domain-containing protein n=1 Tax=Candidatus Regiella endosymbiont of Tuberolachnus salignus TaxID=3077956 RepID=UPI0030D629C7
MKTIALELNTFPLTALMDKSLDSWGIKDRHSRFIYTNRAFLDCFNLPPGVDIIGKRHDELPSCVAEFLANLRQEEKNVIKSGQRTTLIKAHLLRHKQKRHPYLYEIFPLYNQEGRCVGTVFYGKKPDTFSLPPIRYFYAI